MHHYDIDPKDFQRTIAIPFPAFRCPVHCYSLCFASLNLLRNFDEDGAGVAVFDLYDRFVDSDW